MDKIDELKAAIEDLSERLREETCRRTELERRCHILEKLAYRDPATGLRTESYLHNRVREEIDRSTRYPSAASLVTIVAPSEQHSALVELGQLLVHALRSSDHVFRLNSGGLAILMLETPNDGAKSVLDRLSADLKTRVNGFRFTVTSFPDDANLPDEFLSLALHRHAEVAGHAGNGTAGAHN